MSVTIDLMITVAAQLLFQQIPSRTLSRNRCTQEPMPLPSSPGEIPEAVCIHSFCYFVLHLRKEISYVVMVAFWLGISPRCSFTDDACLRSASCVMRFVDTPRCGGLHF